MGPESTGAEAGEETSAELDSPMLRISHGPTHDYGFVALNGQAVQTFEVVNTGTASAVSIAPRSLSEGFAFAGNGYPGEDGTCESTLEPEASCTIVVVFGPTVPKLYAEDIVLDYLSPGGEAFESSRHVTGGGVSGNLLVNGDGEQGGSPPHGWSVPSALDSGTWEATGCERATPQSVPLSGDFCLGHATMAGGGADDFEETGIEQTVALTGWENAIDRAEIRFQFSGAARSRYAENDEWRVWVEFLDAEMNAIADLGDSGWGWTEDWHLLEAQTVAPPGTRHVRTRLLCRITFQPSVYCDAFFDDIVLSALPNES